MKSVLILGATSPVGMGTAEALALAGFKLLLCDSGLDPERVETQLAELDHRLCQSELHRFQVFEGQDAPVSAIDWAFQQTEPGALVWVAPGSPSAGLNRFSERHVIASTASQRDHFAVSPRAILLHVDSTPTFNEIGGTLTQAWPGLHLNQLCCSDLHVETASTSGSLPPRASLHIRSHPQHPTPFDVGQLVSLLLTDTAGWLSGSTLKLASGHSPI